MHLQCLAAAICPQASANVTIFTRFALGVYANTALQPYPHALFKDAIYIHTEKNWCVVLLSSEYGNFQCATLLSCE